MSVPGLNILGMALRVIAPQSFFYLKYTTRTLQTNGLWLAQYASPMQKRGSVQPVPRTLYQAYGLDFQKDYAVFYIQYDILDVSRDVSGDQIIFNNKYYECVSKVDWFKQDGWDSVLAVVVPNPATDT